jgi:hypothetical protein
MFCQSQVIVACGVPVGTTEDSAEHGAIDFAFTHPRDGKPPMLQGPIAWPLAQTWRRPRLCRPHSKGSSSGMTAGPFDARKHGGSAVVGVQRNPIGRRGATYVSQ